MSEFVETREIVERVKDVLSKDIKGNIFDWHVADELGIPYSTLRVMIMKNRLPLKQVALFCYKRDLSITTMIF